MSLFKRPMLLSALAALMSSVPTPTNVDPKLRVPRGRTRGFKGKARVNPLGQANLYNMSAKSVEMNLYALRKWARENGSPKNMPVFLLDRLRTSKGSQAVLRERRNAFKAAQSAA